MLENINAQDILELLNGASIVNPEITVIVKDALPSTNEYIFELIQKDTPPTHKTAIIASIQTAGKGRQGRVWVSPPGNIYLSYYWQFNCALEKLYGLSLTAGIAVARVLQSNGLIDVKLKWPNDIFWQGHKMGGILIETKTKSPGVIDTVIGLGLNVQDMMEYQDQISQKYVSLENALQRKIYKNKLIAQILIELEKVLQQFSTQGFESFVEEWKGYDTLQGKTIEQAR